MAHDVFISCTSPDKPVGDAVCATLESKGIRCWMAPRDILPGADWGKSIVDAVAACRVMVLVFSSNANASNHVKREVERAVNHGLPIIPLRIEDVVPEGALEYFINTPHWLDAINPPMEQHLEYLADVARRIISGTPDAPNPAEAPRPGSPSPEPVPPSPATPPPVEAAPVEAAPVEAAPAVAEAKNPAMLSVPVSVVVFWLKVIGGVLAAALVVALLILATRSGHSPAATTAVADASSAGSASSASSQAPAVPPGMLSAEDFRTVVGLTKDSTLNDAIRLYGRYAKTTSIGDTTYIWSAQKGDWLFFVPGSHVNVFYDSAPALYPGEPVARLAALPADKRHTLLFGFKPAGEHSWKSGDIFVDPSGSSIYVAWR